MANPFTLVGGIILSALFCLVMVYKVLPAADHVVKKERGPVEACIFTRFCALCIALPLYCFTIWMTVVVVFDSTRGISVLEEMCPDDFSCTGTFALGRTNHDLAACDSMYCKEEDLLARSGSQPLGFPSKLGLGEDMSPVKETIHYECVDVPVNESHCGTAVVKGSGEVCECVDVYNYSGTTNLCGQYAGCDGDILDSVHVTECDSLVDGQCRKWSVSTDSAKQFSFQECYCDANSTDCSSFTCDSMTMAYYYPNVFYAGLVTILFILPITAITYFTIKTQMRKLCGCNDMKMYVYSQEAGMQDEHVAENLATGGFTNDQEEKTKLRSFSMKDVALIILGPLIVVFFSWCAVATAGRVGLSFVTLVPVVVILVEVYKFIQFTKKRKERMGDRLGENAPNPGYTG